MVSNTKLNHEKVLQLLKTNVQTILHSYEEPSAIAVSVTWQPGMGDELPYGMLLVKEEATAELLHQCLKQNIKMGDNIVASLRREVAKMQELLVQLNAQLDKQGKSLNEQV